ncbi:50S ribosomal protein L22 family protein [Candidatus Roizmanbacteria bacterium]|nr:50S ribosomal protein L22 family protein [Candidatus Roizmanbacteria bacterium]
MESLTYLKNIKVTPKKLRMFLPAIKKQKPAEAAKVLFYTPNASARILRKAILSAISNAKNTLKVQEDLLQFKLFTIEEGQKMKRYYAGSRGSAKPFVRRFSHIKISLVTQTVTLPQALEVEKKEIEEVVEKKEVKAKKTAVSKVKKETKKLTTKSK